MKRLANNKTGDVKQREEVTYSRKKGVEAAESHYHSGLGGYLCQMNIKGKAYFISSLYYSVLVYY